jgi:NADH-quinone oxidoreductase subunit N
LLVLANAPFLSVLALELLSLASYAGAAWPQTKDSLAAALRYALLGIFSSACLVYGLSWAYGLQQLPTTEATQTAWLGVQVSILIAVLFKLGAFPLHGWVAGVYESAPLPFVAFLSVGPKVAALGWVSHLAAFSHASLAELALPLACVGAASVLAGNVGAFFQTKFLRLMGFSSVAHAGFMLLCLACPAPLEVAGFYALALLGINYMAMGLWGQLEKLGATAQLESVNGWARNQFWLAALAVVSGLALAGLPPTVGFTAKFKLVLGLAHQAATFGRAWAYGLAAFTALNTALSLYYYLRLPYHLIFRLIGSQPIGQANSSSKLALAALGLLLLFFFFAGQLLESFVRHV